MTFHDPGLVVVSVLVAFLASFTSLQLAERMCAYEGAARSGWLCAAAIALGGGIWSMHFVAMLALHMPIGVTYDISLTVSSLLLAIAAAGISYRILVGNPAAPLRLIAGGLIAGFGVAGMHYTGMAAMIMTAAISYDPTLFTVSIVIAVVAATAALWLSFNLRSLWHRLLASLVMAAAIAGMHYTGMAALRLDMGTGPELVLNSGIDQSLLALLITATSSLILVLGLGGSILDRRAADQAVREASIRLSSEQRYRSLVQNSADIIVVLDRENCVRYDTPAAARVLGYTTDAWLGKSFLGFVDPQHQGELRDLLMLLRSEGRAEFELAMATADGAQKWLELSGIDLSADPSVNGVVLTLRDITERRRVAQELQQAKEKAESADRSKAAFLKNVSHELRTPLNAIIGFSDLLVQQPYGTLGDPQYGDFAREINRSGKNLLAVINTIIDFTRAESGQHRIDSILLDPIAELRLCLRMEEEIIQSKNLTVWIEPETSPASLFVDRSKLRQVLMAVLSNAAKFTADHGKIAITIDRDPVGNFAIAIQDNGIGMAEAEIAIALQPFSQVESSLSRRYEGTGLGLAISKALMELHGGELRIQSGLGIGTIITLIFPPERVRPTVQSAAAQ